MRRKRDRDPYRGAPPGLTEAERREWWERQRRKWVWEEGDIVITKRGGDKRPEGEDSGKSPGR